MGSPTRFTQGLSTQKVGTLMGDYPLPDPFHTASSSGLDLYVYQNDFADLGNAASRTVTGASSTFALTDGVGGIGILTPGAATTASSIYRTAASHQFVAGRKFWFVQRVAYSAVGAGITGYFGLIKTGATATDSLLFKLAATGVLSFVSTVNSTATTLVSNVATLTGGTFVDVGFYYNGTDLFVYVSDQLVARISSPTIGSTGTTLTNALLTPITQITPAASETVSIDYALIAHETVR